MLILSLIIFYPIVLLVSVLIFSWICASEQDLTLTMLFSLFFLSIILIPVVPFYLFFRILVFSRNFRQISTNRINKHSNSSVRDDMLADLEYVNNSALEKRLKCDWLPGFLLLIWHEPATAWRTITHRFRIR
jgi:hypothetical protein